MIIISNFQILITKKNGQNNTEYPISCQIHQFSSFLWLYYQKNMKPRQNE